MQAKKIVMAIAAVAVLATVVFAQGQRVTTIDLEGGYVAILNPDSTWSYRQPPLEEPVNDIFITLKDSRILWLKTDYTYTFTRTMPKVAPRVQVKNYPSLSVVGLGNNPDLDRAVKASTEDAYTKATTQLRKILPNALPKDGLRFLTACIKDEVKEHEIERSYNPGWKAEAKIAVNNHRVKKIMDCWELQVAPPQ